MIRQVSFDKNKNLGRLKYVKTKRNGLVELKRVTLTSSADEKQMALQSRAASESSRAALIRQVANQVDEVDHQNYFKESPKYFESESYESTDNKQIPVTTAFPSFFRYNWQIDKKKSSQATETDSKFDDECSDCVVIDKPRKVKNKPVFKDNIMTFCDRSTMTPVLAHVNCGGTPSPSRSVTSCCSPTAREAAPCNSGRPVSPILKKDIDCDCGPTSVSSTRCSDDTNDSETNCRRTLKSDSRRKFLRWFCRNKSKENGCQMLKSKNIYNEGISDVIVEQLPICPRDKAKSSMPCAFCDRPDPCKPIKKCFYNDGFIPYSHKYDSRYHHDCADVIKKKYVIKNCNEGSCRQLYSPRRRCNGRNEQHPKKLLVSELNMEQKGGRNSAKCRKR